MIGYKSKLGYIGKIGMLSTKSAYAMTEIITMTGWMRSSHY
ncbi:hypothetical protein PN499_17260 [Kamptonema animale CS-326]|nr:hypothetical protein [Kamptonema animale]MDB9512942.1 hypothetical protein [Kamptonema animale CS-326]